MMNLFASLPAAVTVTDTTLRDGLQSLPDTQPLPVKLAIIEALAGAGLRSLEITSFMRTDRVPQLADAEALIVEARARHGKTLELRALVANARGLDRALAAGVDAVVVLMTLSDAYAHRNQGVDSSTNLRQAAELTAAARAAGVAADVAFSMPIFCPYEGQIPPIRLTRATATLAEAGAPAFTLCTSTGLEDPREVTDALATIRAEAPDAAIALHLHDTNGMAPAIALAGLLSGVVRFETALGGLGGGIALPSGMPGHGNLPTEDLMNMLWGLGLGPDPTPVIAVANAVGTLLGRTPNSRASRGATKTAVLAASRRETDDA